MPTQVSKSQFKAKALEYFRLVETSGKPLVVTDHGQPRLEVRPYRGEHPHPLDILKGCVLRYEAPTAPVGLEDWGGVVHRHG